MKYLGLLLMVIVFAIYSNVMLRTSAVHAEFQVDGATAVGSPSTELRVPYAPKPVNPDPSIPKKSFHNAIVLVWRVWNPANQSMIYVGPAPLPHWDYTYQIFDSTQDAKNAIKNCNLKDDRLGTFVIRFNCDKPQITDDQIVGMYKLAEVKK